jgi:hypothetical protein
MSSAILLTLLLMEKFLSLTFLISRMISSRNNSFDWAVSVRYFDFSLFWICSVGDLGLVTLFSFVEMVLLALWLPFPDF